MIFDFNDIFFMEIGFYLMFFLSFIILSYYLFSKRTKSLLFVLIGDISFTSFFFVVILSISNKDLSLAPVVALFDLTSIVFFVTSILILFNFKVPVKSFVVISLINVISIVILQRLTSNFGIYRFVTSLIIVIVIVYAGHKLKKSEVANKLPSFMYSLVVVGVFSLFKMFLSSYRLLSFFQGEIWFSRDISVNIMTFTSLCFVLWINFAIIFLTHDLLNREINEFSYTDYLTKLPNRRRIDEQLNFYFEMKKRNLLSFAVVILDIDDFKEVNDKYGHDIGDEVLQDLGVILSKAIRTVDFVGRYGGEEFLVLIQGQSKEDVSVVIERILNGIRSNKYSTENISLTASGGVIFVDEGFKIESASELISLADEKLYEAKRDGKNKVLYYLGE